MTNVQPTTLQQFSEVSAARRKQENFPVASWFLPRHARAATLAFYHFARHADDIADNPALSREEKLAALAPVGRALLAGDKAALPEWARAYHHHVQLGDVDCRHGRALLSAFMQDASKGRYANWDELRDYCMRSAAPVGHAVLEIHREWRADIHASDALCNALQLLNHLQDLKSDFMERHRIYLPIGWLDNPDHLSGDFATPDVRQAINRALKKVEAMLVEAAPLPGTISGFRLRAEICTILNVAHALARELKTRDPIGTRVELSLLQKCSCLARGIGMAFRQRGGARRFSILRAARTSFFWPIVGLPREKRAAMAALYRFCRVTDDAIDEAPSAEEIQRNLHFWRTEVAALYSDAILAYPSHPVTRALLPAVRKFHFRREHLEGILDGLAMDASGAMLRPSAYQLDRYCYGVASCVGLLSVAIFGYTNPQAEEFAIHLGKAFQYINILRDVREDAGRGRIYLPQELLMEHGLGRITPEALCHPERSEGSHAAGDPSPLAQDDSIALRLRPVLAELGKLARNHLAQADEFLPPEDRKSLAPALAMRRIYTRYLPMMEAQGWNIAAPRVRLPGWKKLWLAIKR